MQSSLNPIDSTSGSAGCVMRDMIRRAERFYPAKTAMVCGAHRWTYREFGTRIRKLAGALSSLGISKGDRVADLMLNCHRYLEALPKSASGKVLKRELRESYWQGYTRRMN